MKPKLILSVEEIEQILTVFSEKIKGHAYQELLQAIRSIKTAGSYPQDTIIQNLNQLVKKHKMEELLHTHHKAKKSKAKQKAKRRNKSKNLDLDKIQKKLQQVKKHLSSGHGGGDAEALQNAIEKAQENNQEAHQDEYELLEQFSKQYFDLDE